MPLRATLRAGRKHKLGPHHDELFCVSRSKAASPSKLSKDMSEHMTRLGLRDERRISFRGLGFRGLGFRKPLSCRQLHPVTHFGRSQLPGKHDAIHKRILTMTTSWCLT